MGGSLCRVAHPSLGINALTKTELQILHQIKHDLLGRFGEELFSIHPPESFAHLRLHLIGGTLPERVVLLTATHGFPEKVEIGFPNFIGQIAGRIHNNVPLHGGPQFISRCKSGNFVQTGHKLRLTNNQFLDVVMLYAFGFRQSRKWNIGIVGLKFFEGHLVVISLRVAQFGHTL